jgi:transcriptional regulator with XRE-family HTH domain
MLVNIEAERVRKQLTKEDLSEKFDVSLKTYYNWINEERDVPSKKLKQMALIFGTSMDYLMQGCIGVESMKEVV